MFTCFRFVLQEVISSGRDIAIEVVPGDSAFLLLHDLLALILLFSASYLINFNKLYYKWSLAEEIMLLKLKIFLVYLK